MSIGLAQWRAAIGVFNYCNLSIPLQKGSPLFSINYNSRLCYFLYQTLSFLIVLVSSPLLVFICSIFSNFPILRNVSSSFSYCDDLKYVFKTSLLLARISLHFIIRIISHVRSRPSSLQNCCKNILTHSIFSILVLFYLKYINLMLLLCGDIEVNPGPSELKKLSICHWNLN